MYDLLIKNSTSTGQLSLAGRHGTPGREKQNKTLHAGFVPMTPHKKTTITVAVRQTTALCPFGKERWWPHQHLTGKLRLLGVATQKRRSSEKGYGGSVFPQGGRMRLALRKKKNVNKGPKTHTSLHKKRRNNPVTFRQSAQVMNERI